MNHPCRSDPRLNANGRSWCMRIRPPAIKWPTAWPLMDTRQFSRARHIEEVQPDLPHIRPDVIVVDLHPSAKPALPYFQSVCPLVPIIAMMRPGHFSRESGRDVQANACGAGVFVCESPDRERHSAHPQ